MDDLQRAYHLRHRSDRARLDERLEDALGDATEAVALYANSPDRLLDLANALRLKALALDSLDQPGAAAIDWAEARRLYAGLGVVEGVTECDARLAR
jgi:hypothetical protein